MLASQVVFEGGGDVGIAVEVAAVVVSFVVTGSSEGGDSVERHPGNTRISILSHLRI